MGCSKSSSKREVYSNKILPQGTRNISNNNLTLYLKQLEKEEQKSPKLAEGKNYKNQIRNTWKTNDGNNSKDQ